MAFEVPHLGQDRGTYQKDLKIGVVSSNQGRFEEISKSHQDAYSRAYESMLREE
jgi:hypothetical protein